MNETQIYERTQKQYTPKKTNKMSTVVQHATNSVQTVCKHVCKHVLTPRTVVVVQFQRGRLLAAVQIPFLKKRSSQNSTNSANSAIGLHGKRTTFIGTFLFPPYHESNNTLRWWFHSSTRRAIASVIAAAGGGPSVVSSSAVPPPSFSAASAAPLNLEIPM